MEKWMEHHVPKLFRNKFNRDGISGASLTALEKASPSNSTSWFGFLTDAVAIRASHIYPAFVQYCTFSGNLELLSRLETAAKSFIEKPFLMRGLPLKKALTESVFSRVDGQPVVIPSVESALANGDASTVPLGQLAFKEEAAGKLRVFAMVDVWTQSLMRPLHDTLFKLLQSLPNDGTFDQEASFARCVSKASISHCAFGYDLSAATDRLPVRLQTVILSQLIGKEAAEAWQTLLVGREYLLPKNAANYGYSPGVRLTYSVGQPMGALSSWAMLALTHHLIVQYCY
jgi:hypothetical protein